HTDYDHNTADNDLSNASHSAYGVFANGLAVCEGICLAYKSLLDEINIKNYIVLGKSSVNHSWNVMLIDDKYYHIDVTQDSSDSNDILYPRISHDMFLVSNENNSFSFSHSNYYMYKDYQKMDVPATSTTYDNAFWKYVYSPITAANGSFYYIKNNKLYKTTSYDDSALSIEIAELNAISKSSVSYSGLFRMNDRIYFNDKYAVYSIALDGTDKRAEYQITDTTNGYISGVDRTGDQIYIELYKDDTFTKSDISLAGGSIELQPMEIGFENSEEELYENDTLQLSVKAYPGGEISNITWTSDNTAVVTVSSSGLVTPVATGTAKVTAEWNSMKAECTITVKENSSPAEQHYVIFREPNGDFITSCYVDDGCDAPLPDYSAPDGYSLSWTENYINVRQDETVTAVFTPIEYNITYELDGGTNAAGNPSKYTIETDDITLASPTKDEMIFDGWYHDSSFATKVDIISKGSYGNITLYAKWTAESSNKYLITFKAPDGTVLKEEQVTEGHDATLPEYPAPNGYNVTWNGNYTDVRQNETITAVLTPIEYDITYVLDGGTNATENPAKYTIETDNIALASPTKDGATFDGWYYDSSFVTKVDIISKGSYGNITLYAKWIGKNPEDNPNYRNGLWIEEIRDIYYTGSTIKPAPVVYDGMTRLVSGKDFSVSYKNNTNAGTAQVIITGKGNYKGKVTTDFNILPVDIETASVYDMSVMYKAGKRQTPVPTIELNGKKLKDKKDFSVSYQGSCTEPGEYDVTVSGTGNYTGTRQIKLVIASGNEILISKASVSKIPDVTYTGNPVAVNESSITVKYKGRTLEKGTDYEIQYGSYIDSGTYDLLIVGKGQYRGVKTVKFNIKGIAIKKAAMAPVTVPYTGTAQTPDIKLTFEGKSLVYGTDYVTAFENNVNKGKATVRITGMGRFSGTVTKTFNITAQPVSAAEISFDGNGNSFPYVKGGTIPEITVKCDGNVLRKGVDYTVTGKNNQKVGNAMLVIKGIGNYSGTVNKSFAVTTQDIAKVLLMLPDVEYTGRKGGYKTKPVLMDTSGKTLSTSDYDGKNVIYKDAAGNVLDKNSIANTGDVISVTIKGKGNYSGEITGTYRIIPKGRSIAKARQDKIVKEYTGKEIVLSKEEISLSIGGSKIPTDGFEIVPGSYVNNINKGTASVTVRGVGEYGGIKTITFKIDMQNLKWGK
ncbi:MAG: InlB B-repeat-containing protein, partial [Lachnospiraceae bacterium]|nr:InlB B-repeat-containing protein [Lachnospiraceae bacterium]